MKLGPALIAACWRVVRSGSAPAPDADLIIRGGTVYTGDAAPFTGDVAIKDDKIVAVGTGPTITATRTIDASGMIVAPGFIDPHTMPALARLDRCEDAADSRFPAAGRDDRIHRQ